MELRNSNIFLELEKRNSPFVNNLNNAFEYVKNILPMIVTVFTNYTQHDVGHSVRVSNYMYELVDDISNLNDLEITLMLLAALFHDIGMVVTEDEIKLIKDDIYTGIECKYSLVVDTLKNEKLALQECIRPMHAIRSAQHLYNLKQDYKVWFRVPESTNLSMLEDVAKLCQSHNESIDWIKTEIDSEGYKGENFYNLQYIALLLRLADLLDFDEQRTPDYLYHLINPKGFSDSEWKQHFIIHNTKKIYLNEKNNQKVIRFFGESSEPGIHRKFLKYIDYINKELLEAVNISDTFTNTKYALNVKPNIENKVKTNRFTFSDFKLDLDYNAVTNLLMGERIYGDKKYGLRELIQNSIDACMLMKEVAKDQEEFIYEPYRPYINIVLDKDKNEAIVVDNGVGMSLDILKKYFLNVGVSYYSSNEYKYKGYDYRPIGNYGIGFLACFMLSDNVKVNTKRYDDNKLNCIELESNSEYICLTQANTQRKQGTEVILDLQEFITTFQISDKVKEFIEKNFVSCGIPIKIVYIKDGATVEQECKLTEFMENSNTIARLDKYMNNITGYVEISNVSIDFIKCLDDVDGTDAYLYDNKTNDLIRATNIKISLNDFVEEGKIAYLSVPLIESADSTEFKKFLEVLDDFNEAINKLDSAEYINIFSLSETLDIYEGQHDYYSDNIIGKYTFKQLCEEHGHDISCPTYVEKQQRTIIHNDSDILLPYSKNKTFGSYLWERKDRVFVKNVFVSDFAITLPYLADGINLKSALFNVKNKAIIPNVARNNVPKEGSEKFSYAVGKALHLWILDNVSLTKPQKELVKKVIDECYSETNEFLKS